MPESDKRMGTCNGSLKDPCQEQSVFDRAFSWRL